MKVRCLHTKVFHHIRILVWGGHPRLLSTTSYYLAGGHPQSEAPSKTKYKDTVILPSTTFPRIVKPDNIPQNERWIQQAGGFDSLYSWQQREDRDKSYVLHDGPPYANGVPHIGHAVNKILKDITVRHKLLRGYKINYIPGWDCHGLPIELKAAATKDGARQSDPLKIRAAARKVAEGAIVKQREAFERWGLLADWGLTYRTLDPTYVTRQLHLFADLFEKGYIYQDYLPVYYSPNLGTSLAESELEYNPEHVSTAVYLAMPITTPTAALQAELDAVDVCTVHLVIWTTTPWTLPANQAVCVAPDQSYAVVALNQYQELGPSGGELVVVWAESLLDDLRRIVKGDVEVKCIIEGTVLEGVEYQHPFNHSPCPVIGAGHVRMDSGSGLVHTAPAHGPDDYLVALKHNLSVECLVNSEGRFVPGAGEGLEGKEVLGEGNEAVLQILERWSGPESMVLLHREPHTHSYPYDWRSKRPVIMLATRQWFLNTAKLKDAALKALESVKILPGKGTRQAGMVAQLRQRPYWCISRQRVWGTPLPVFYDANTGQPVVNRQTIEHVAKVLGEEGSDAWWTLGEDKLLPQQLVRKHNNKTSHYPARLISGHSFPPQGQDTLDIWFDSGSSWRCVLDSSPADMYLEGLDQFNGWFLSSLLTSVGITGQAPYRTLYVHGYALDKDGRKMSKSLGNVVDPWVVTDGGKNKNKDPAYGADTLRWWVATKASESAQYRIGTQQLTDTKTAVQRIRSVLRHILACLNTGENNGDANNGRFSFSQHSLPVTDLRPLDRYILHLLHAHLDKVWQKYEDLSYFWVAQHSLHFITNTVSGLYFGCVQDRLYCEDKSGAKRMSAQLVLYHLLHHLQLSLAPILPHLTQEIDLYRHHNNQGQPSVFHEVYEAPPSSWHQPELAAMMEVCLQVREELYRITSATTTTTKSTTTTKPASPAKLHVTVTAGGSTLQALKLLQSSSEARESGLCELFQVAAITLQPHSDEGFSVAVCETDGGQCLRCRRYTASPGAELCTRCHTVINTMKADNK